MPIRRILTAILLSFVTSTLVGCGGGEKAPPKAGPDAPKPPGEPEGGP